MRELLMQALEQASPVREKATCEVGPSHVTVPEGLRFYKVEAGRAADYDWLLRPGGAR